MCRLPMKVIYDNEEKYKSEFSIQQRECVCDVCVTYHSNIYSPVIKDYYPIYICCNPDADFSADCYNENAA